MVLIMPAISKAVSETAASASRPIIEEILVVTDATPPWPPCGLCRQVIAEFANENTLIHACNLKGIIETFRFEELVPRAFTPAHLLPQK